MKLTHDYLQLPGLFYSELQPVPVQNPKMLVYNDALAEELGLSDDKDAQLLYFSGNAVPKEARPLAQAYSGHQFGYYTRLGDGRAVLIGEIEKDGALYDLQLKGAGRTPYSRGGDGRAAVAPMLREYLLSEAMHALGIPTTRSLAVVKTGETVLRQIPQEGAVLTRVAKSHLRVGTFQYAQEKGGNEAVRTLADYAIRRHKIPAGDNPLLSLFQYVADKQAELIAAWMRIGFIHGVMNTDNVSIAGETIDYGPCAFMDTYDENTVFSTIDRQGRYAYKNQPRIGQWNLARFAEALLGTQDEAEAQLPAYEKILTQYEKRYKEAYYTGMAAKIGIADPDASDRKRVDDLLAAMKKSGADYTNTFVALTRGETCTATQLSEWTEDWKKRLTAIGETKEAVFARMRANNPVVIPRNYAVELALAAAEKGDMAPFHKLLAQLTDPFCYDQPTDPLYTMPMPAQERQRYQTYCGT